MAVAPLTVTTAHLGGDAYVISLAGELDLATVDARERDAELVFGAGARRLVVDLVGTTFLDSVSLGVITRLGKRLRARQGELVVVANDPRIVRVFEITGLDRIFRIVRSLAEAVEELIGGRR